MTADDNCKGSCVCVIRQLSALMLMRLMLFNESESRGKGREKVEGREKGERRGKEGRREGEGGRKGEGREREKGGKEERGRREGEGGGKWKGSFERLSELTSVTHCSLIRRRIQDFWREEVQQYMCAKNF